MKLLILFLFLPCLLKAQPSPPPIPQDTTTVYAWTEKGGVTQWTPATVFEAQVIRQHITVAPYVLVIDTVKVTGIYQVGGAMNLGSFTGNPVLQFYFKYTNEFGVPDTFGYYQIGSGMGILDSRVYPLPIWCLAGTTITIQCKLYSGSGTYLYDIYGEVKRIYP